MTPYCIIGKFAVYVFALYGAAVFGSILVRAMFKLWRGDYD